MAAVLDHKIALSNLWTHADARVRHLHVLLQLKQVTKRIVDATGKENLYCLPKSGYDDWEKITEVQAKKIYKLWEVLTPDERASVLEKANAMTEVASVRENMRQDLASDNEYVRLLYLLKLPQAVIALTAIRQGMERDQLDAVHLGNEETMERTEPYRVLATYYNNRDPEFELNQLCKNPCIKRNATGEVACADPLQDGNRFQALFNDCKHIDPNSPDILERDPAWIKSHIKRVEKVLSQIAKNFTRSGQQRGFDVYSEWSVYFADKSAAWAKLAIAIFDYTEMREWCYDLPEQVARTSCIFSTTSHLSSG
eukprot:gene9307-10273_t